MKEVKGIKTLCLVKETRTAYRILVGGDHLGGWLCARPQRSVEDDIKIDIRRISFEYMDWIIMAQDCV
jgi:hypothetical protein